MVCEPHLVLLALPRTLVPVVSFAPALTGGQHHTIAVRISVTAAGPLMLLLTTPAPCGHNLLRRELHRYLRPVPDLHLRGMLHLHACCTWFVATPAQVLVSLVSQYHTDYPCQERATIMQATPQPLMGAALWHLNPQEPNSQRTAHRGQAGLTTTHTWQSNSYLDCRYGWHDEAAFPQAAAGADG